jgi:putative methionine-R-sulfoxide reductase with GAF domain
MTNKKRAKTPLSISVLESITYLTKAIALGDLVGQEALDEILQLAAKITNSEFGTIQLYNNKNNTLKVAGILGDIPNSVKDMAIDAGVGITGYVAQKRQTVLINEIPKNDDYIEFFNTTLSELAVPILSGEDLIGVLNLESLNKNNYSEESVRVIELLTSLLGTALKKEELEKASNELVAAKHIDTSKNFVFVLMPFREPFNKYYRTIIRPAIEDINLLSLRVDEIYGPTSISEDIWDNINRAKVVIAELSTRNPNVMYELGLSHGVGKPVIMMSQSIDDIPFDLRHLRCILYDTTEPEWASLLRNNLTESIKSVLAGKGENSPYFDKQSKTTVA